METKELKSHLKVQAAKRDLKWEQDFFSLFVKSYVKISRPDPLQGPDGWPYLLVETHEDGPESIVDVVRWLSTRGIGLVVNPNQATPDYVFSYGMLWNFIETGSFISPQVEDKRGLLEIRDGEQLFVGPPTDKFLPKYARAILREFLLRQMGEKAKQGGPRIAMISRDQKEFDLCFSLESIGNPPAEEHRGILEAISWFLPLHYRLAILSEKVVTGFLDL